MIYAVQIVGYIEAHSDKEAVEISKTPLYKMPLLKGHLVTQIAEIESDKLAARNVNIIEIEHGILCNEPEVDLSVRIAELKQISESMFQALDELKVRDC